MNREELQQQIGEKADSAQRNLRSKRRRFKRWRKTKKNRLARKEYRLRHRVGNISFIKWVILTGFATMAVGWSMMIAHTLSLVWKFQQTGETILLTVSIAGLMVWGFLAVVVGGMMTG